MKSLLPIILLPCALYAQQPSLPNFPAPAQYTYTIPLPEGTKAVAIFWYYGWESRERIIYSSGAVAVKCCVLQTEMTFPWAGTYVYVIYYQGRKVEKYRKKYTVYADI